MSRHQFLSLGLFLVVSLGWSLVFFTVRPLDFLPEVLPAPFGLLIAWLPPLGMFAVSLLLRRTSFSELPTSFFGESRKWSILIALVPIGLLGGFGVDNEMGIQANLFGLFMGALLIIYTILEEYGWRGYLQHALPIRSEWLKYTLIALVWYIWHWDFLDGIGWGSLLIWGLMIFGAMGIGRLAEQKKSLLICAAFHAMGNIVMFSQFLREHMALESRLIIVGICIGVWVMMFRIWDRPQEQEALTT